MYYIVPMGVSSCGTVLSAWWIGSIANLTPNIMWDILSHIEEDGTNEEPQTVDHLHHMQCVPYASYTYQLHHQATQ